MIDAQELRRLADLDPGDVSADALRAAADEIDRLRGAAQNALHQLVEDLEPDVAAATDWLRIALYGDHRRTS